MAQPADYHQAARLMLRKFGPQAAARATQRAWHLREQGDEAGFELWIDIGGAIEEIRSVMGPQWVPPKVSSQRAG